MITTLVTGIVAIVTIAGATIVGAFLSAKDIGKPATKDPCPKCGSTRFYVNFCPDCGLQRQSSNKVECWFIEQREIEDRRQRLARQCNTNSTGPR